jgi:hypothetical protein
MPEQCEVPQEIREAFGPEEALHPDLFGSKCELRFGRVGDGSESVVTIINHPLVLSLYHGEVFHHQLNSMLRQKTEALKVAWKEHDWRSFIWLHERPYRPGALKKVLARAILGELTPEDYWDLCASVWVDTEQEDDPVWHTLWKNKLSHHRRHAMQTFEEVEAFGALALGTTLYRGEGRELRGVDIYVPDRWSWAMMHGQTVPDHRRRWSWTTDIEIARRFAGRSGAIRTIRVADLKSPPLVFIGRRGESEVLVDPLSIPRLP